MCARLSSKRVIKVTLENQITMPTGSQQFIVFVIVILLSSTWSSINCWETRKQKLSSIFGPPTFKQLLLYRPLCARSVLTTSVKIGFYLKAVFRRISFAFQAIQKQL